MNEDQSYVIITVRMMIEGLGISGRIGTKEILDIIESRSLRVSCLLLLEFGIITITQVPILSLYILDTQYLIFYCLVTK